MASTQSSSAQADTFVGRILQRLVDIRPGEARALAKLRELFGITKLRIDGGGVGADKTTTKRTDSVKRRKTLEPACRTYARLRVERAAPQGAFVLARSHARAGTSAPGE